MDKDQWFKRQEKIESYRKEKQGIIEDLRVCISYTPDRDNDLLCFMEQYLKAEKKNRPRLLEQIKCCINGENMKIHSSHITSIVKGTLLSSTVFLMNILRI